MIRRRLKGWGWAAAGAVCVLLCAWAGITLYTLLKQRSDERRITHVEEVVIGLEGHRVLQSKGVVAGSGSIPHGQPSPGHAPGGSEAHGHTEPHHPAPSGGDQPAPSAPSSPVPPTPRSAPAPEAPPAAAPIPPPAPPAEPLAPALTQTAGAAVNAVVQTVCSVEALGIEVCRP